MNDNRQENKDMLEDIIEDLSRENEFRGEGQERQKEQRRPAPSKKSGNKLWIAIIAAVIIVAATWYIFKSGAEPTAPPAAPATPAVAEDATGSQSGTIFTPSATETNTASEAAQAAAATGAASTSQPEQSPAVPTIATNEPAQPSDSSGEVLRLAEEEKAKAEEAARLAAEEKAKAEAAAKARLEAEAEEKAKAEAAAPAAAPESASEASANQAAAQQPQGISDLWVVNISSTPDAAESQTILKKVMAADAGGLVYAYETTVDGKLQNRIRVGFFNTREEAEAVGQKLKETHKLPSTPWAVQPTVEEVDRYTTK